MRTSLLVLAALAVVPATAHASWNVDGVQFGQNGQRLQGQRLQGQRLQGQRLQGQRLQGVNLQNATLQGVNLSNVKVNVTLDGTSFEGTLLDVEAANCSHSQAATGAPLPSSCNKCAEIVNTYDSYCGQYWWDGICVSEAKDWCAFESADLIGAEFAAKLDNNATVQLRLDAVAVVPDPTPYWVWQWNGSTYAQVNMSGNENADVLAYEFNIHVPQEVQCGYRTECEDPYGCWTYYTCWESQAAEIVPLCEDDADGLRNQSIPVAGRWNDCVGQGCGGKTPGYESTNFSLACRDEGALAKCVERFGYKPWEDPFDPIAAPMHESCVRMVRADYCGDGMAHTYDGTWIDAYDRVGVQQSTTNWGNEGMWQPQGAYCVINGRYEMAEPPGTGYDTLGEYIENECPYKFLPAAGRYEDRWRCGVDVRTEYPGMPRLDADPALCAPVPGLTLVEGTWCRGYAATDDGHGPWEYVGHNFNGWIGNKSKSLPWPGE